MRRPTEVVQKRQFRTTFLALCLGLFFFFPNVIPFNTTSGIFDVTDALAASNLKYSVLLKNARLDAITSQVGASGKLLIYSGTQATNPDTAIGAQVLLATLPCSATFAPGASGGVLTVNAITSGTGTAGAAGGTAATWFRFTKSDGTTGVVDGSVGTSAADLNLSSTVIATGQTVSVTSYTVTSGN